MKKFLSIVLAALLVLSTASVALADGLVVAVPNDPTNEGRALLLLQSLGVITMKEDAGITATADDIIDNPLGITFYEVEAPMVTNVRYDVDYAIINNNFAIDAGIITEALAYENADSPYVNVVSVNAGNEDTDAAKALAAALNSQAVVDYLKEAYSDLSDPTKGFAVPVVTEPTDGYDATVDYAALAGTTISVACSPAPHHQILEVAAKILAEKNITLEIIDFSDYIQPNMVVDSGEVFANFFAHNPYQENFNAENGTNLVTIAGIHVEPMGLYGGKQADLTALLGE